MDHNYPMITAAVAAAIAGGYATTAAAQPSVGAAAGATNTLVISGSSAAQSSIANAIETSLCGGTYLAVQSGTASGLTDPDKNFFAYSCDITATNVGIPAGSLVTIYYRSEGGSVTGALPIATEKQIKRLNLSDGSCASTGSSTATCTVTGVTSTNGPNDSWNGAVTPAYVQLGVTDVEPGQLVGLDSPINATFESAGAGYATSVFGNATNAQMVALNNTAIRAIQQVFGIAVNQNGITNPNGNKSVNLTRESVGNILSGAYTDWSQVPDALTGAPVSSTHAIIQHVDREPGSGTRTSANIFFLNYGCSASATTAIPYPYSYQSGEVLNYSTGDELTLANTTNASISYASIDNLLAPKNSAYPNLTLATINGVAPSTLSAATGQYEYWYEATLVPNNATYLSGNSALLATWLENNVPKLASAPIAADINVIPIVDGNPSTVPLTSSGSGTTTIYVNPFTRNKNSCNVPSQTNVQ